MAADCENGPATQQICEQNCASLLQSECAAEYGALLQCAEGEEVTCGPAGFPTVAACADEQDAFIACLN